MIIYALKCDKDHEFESWFPSSSDFEKQKSQDMVQCPICSSFKVEIIPGGRLISGASSSKLSDKKQASAQNASSQQVYLTQNEMIRLARNHVLSNFKNVGDKFYQHAIDIHNGKEKPKSIYGTATPEEKEQLKEENVHFFPIPEEPKPDA